MQIRFGLGNLSLALITAFGVSTLSAQAPVLRNPEVNVARGAVSIPVRDMPEAPLLNGRLLEKPLRLVHPANPITSIGDPVLQDSATVNAAIVTAGLNIEGLGNGFPGFSVNAAPPDTNGTAGATQFVQWVNESFEVFSKTGTPLKGPVAGNTVFAALGNHPCALNNDGDPIAQYDKANNRWILTQFSVTNGSVEGFWQCVAVSTTNDATGTFNVYAFQQPNFNDYPKLGVWPTGYFVTFNMFTNVFQGPRICALDGAAMRAGAATATQICFQLPNTFGSILPSDVDGTMAPPGDPYFVSFGSAILNVWRANVNFTAGTGTLTGPITTSISAFSEACSGGSCIPQPSTSQKLDSLGDRLMYRFAYRNFGNGKESLLVNHSVKVSRKQPAGVRWYELSPNASTGGLSLVQSGTFAPADGASRWMGSIAQDKFGNIAVGYSVSSGSVFPSIRVATRAPADPPGTLGSETNLFLGSGSQLRNLNRWGDYSSMALDPVDDCTFWYTTEYLAENGTFNWHTRIATFKLPGC
ncbi:MAG TPA: hypothetical protein VFR84_07830 [Candidatus Angelobacter sp.]|nr:hypothetical protein [Candidatus Angelobacter sp.]